jgi:DNA-binding transcriptional regulator YiaG
MENNCGDLVESMRQHNEIIAGARKAARATKVDAQSIKVLRSKGGLAQEKFLALLHVDLSTQRNCQSNTSIARASTTTPSCRTRPRSSSIGCANG